MSSELLGSAQNVLKGNLGGAWDINKGYADAYTDLGIARRFGGASAAYSLRDIGAINGRVVKARRDVGETSDPEEDFSANQISSGALEDWVNGKLESTLPADVATAAAAYSLRKVKASYSGDAVRIRRSSDNVEVIVGFDSDDKVSASSAITNVSEEGGESGQTTATTLGGFINSSEDFSDFKVDSEWSDNLASFSSVGKTSFSVQAKSLGSFNSTDTVRVSAPITNIIAEPQASVTKFKTTFTIDSISGEGNGNDTDGALYIKGANSPNGNGSWNFHNSPDGAGGNVTFKFTSAGTYTVEGYGEDETDAYNLAFKTFSFIIYSGTQVSVSNVSMEVLNDCTVHTWYDQAGVNNATQATDANQPKIAENGALLADGLDFDGTDSLVTGSFSASQPITIFSVTETDVTTGTRIVESETNTNLFYYGSAVQIGFTSGTNLNSAVGGYSINVPYLITHLANGSSSKIFRNSLEIASGNAGTNSFAGSLHIGGSTNHLNGRFRELVIYDSDQSANRFKIESNINNYYGLYNDANETSATAFSFSGERSEGTTSSNGLDGFTLDVETASAFAGFQLEEKVANTKVIYVSFNAVLTGGSGGASSPQIKLRTTSISGDTASNTSDVVSGFNSFALTSNNDNAEYLSFSEGDDNRIFTISDFKVSRIARNGFVETWYDQSGNANNAVQATATEQPSIVKNGGIVKLNAKPSVDFDGVDNYFTFTNNFNFNLEPTSVSRPVNTIMFVGENTAGSRSFLGDKGSTKNWIAAPYNGRYQFRDNGSTIYDTTVSTTLGSQLVLSIQCPSEDDFSIRENGSAKTLGGTNNITAAIGIRDIGAGYTLSGNANYQTMKAQEFYFHNERLTNDIVDIENDAINYYNIS